MSQSIKASIPPDAKSGDYSAGLLPEQADV